MKVGVLTGILGSMKLEQALDYLAGLGVQAVEIGTGGYPGSAHCPVDALLESEGKCRYFLHAVTSRGLQISALSCHGNPIHPIKKTAVADDLVFQKTVRLAEKLGVGVVNTFSGCPGGHAGAKQPNWVTCAWPPEYPEILKYQWDEVVIPYWAGAVDFARKHGLGKVGLEMHPGFVVYNPETLLRLREAVGGVIGANFDPSHLVWQGIDPCEALRALRGAIYHVHAKDTAIHQWNARINGVLDTKPYSDEVHRSWVFRTVGYGNSRKFWADFVSMLRLVEYDGALSIEHEDSLMTPKEGLEKAIRFLDRVVMRGEKGEVSWA